MTPNPRALVLGATGNTGSLVAAGLARLGLEVRAAARSAPVRFDWDDPDTWSPALGGVHSAYLVAPMVPDLAVRQVAEFVERAVGRGVRRLVLLSGRSALAASARMLALENVVRGSGAEWTILRPGVFNQNFSVGPLRRAVLAGEVRRVATGDVPVDFIDVSDIAEVAVAAMSSDGHAGAVYELSGPAALPYSEALALISRATGRDIRFVEVDPVEWAEEQRALGVPADVIDWGLEAADGVRAGFYSTPFDGVRRVLGRPPRAFADFVEAASASGAWR